MKNFVTAMKVLGRLPSLVEPCAMGIGSFSPLENKLPEERKRHRGGGSAGDGLNNGKKAFNFVGAKCTGV